MGKKNDFLWTTPSADVTATTEIQQQVQKCLTGANIFA